MARVWRRPSRGLGRVQFHGGCALGDRLGAVAMDVDVSSAVIRALSFIAEFQAAGAAMFLLLFARKGISVNNFAAGAALARRAAGVGIVLVLMHQLLDAARMRREF